ncbi:family 1 glycosylhydrolase [Protaetiibacter sp. SSC-01]|uniref:family 1 glycosylhydrolase n=1 Tax=Protaetiibacter sp. SSC-01 TaxID=2759943 RepID=UPI0016572071|nr:family 1 glycosylhydrolase [Protaetiibacter sp. SSC-01]QNO37149.1 family 1 glycosylhydrolase [Protaetiibacter sp. SSC-01]
MTTPWYRDGELHFGVGIEDTFVPQERSGERAIDEYALTEHDIRWHDDLGLAADAGARFVRWGVPWYRVQPEPDRFDWSWLDGVFARFAELGLRPIVDLMHYGTPLWMPRQFDDADYPQRVAEYSARVAERYADTVSDYTPLNEPMIHALFSGEYAYWPPYLAGQRGLVRMVDQLARGFALAQLGMRDVLGERAAFVHVDAGMRYAGDLDAADQRELAHRLRHQVWLVEDLVTGRVSDRHPLRALLAEHGVGDDALAWFADHAVQPDVYGINYYPRHSTELLESGVHHGGGFGDPRPVRDDGVDGLVELLREGAARYGAPVMVSETCVTASVPERAAWLAESSQAVRRLRAEGVDVVGYTWWPLFDMYEWTWRHSTAPREAHRLTMGLYELVETPAGLERRPTPLVDAFRREATSLENRP